MVYNIIKQIGIKENNNLTTLRRIHIFLKITFSYEIYFFKIWIFGSKAMNFDSQDIGTTTCSLNAPPLIFDVVHVSKILVIEILFKEDGPIE